MSVFRGKRTTTCRMPHATCLVPHFRNEKCLGDFYYHVFPSLSQDGDASIFRRATTPPEMDGEIAGRGGALGGIVLSQPVLNASPRLPDMGPFEKYRRSVNDYLRGSQEGDDRVRFASNHFLFLGVRTGT